MSRSRCFMFLPFRLAMKATVCELETSAAPEDLRRSTNIHTLNSIAAIRVFHVCQIERGYESIPRKFFSRQPKVSKSQQTNAAEVFQSPPEMNSALSQAAAIPAADAPAGNTVRQSSFDQDYAEAH